MRSRSAFIFRWHALAAGAALASAFIALPSHAALFEDDEARRAILELRQRADTQRAQSDRQVQDTEQLRRALLDLQGQIEGLRGEVARMTGQNEQLQREIADLQRRQKDIVQGVDDRMRKLEPSKVSVDGKEFTADPRESAEYEAGLAIFRKGDFPGAQKAFTDFLGRYPQSGFRPPALFWLGNSQYANRDYKGAIANFRQLLASSPDNQRAPEALLSIANCQIELKDNGGARKTLDELMRTYPQSEAAGAARERLSKLR